MGWQPVDSPCRRWSPCTTDNWVLRGPLVVVGRPVVRIWRLGSRTDGVELDISQGRDPGLQLLEAGVIGGEFEVTLTIFDQHGAVGVGAGVVIEPMARRNPVGRIGWQLTAAKNVDGVLGETARDFYTPSQTPNLI